MVIKFLKQVLVSPQAAYLTAFSRLIRSCRLKRNFVWSAILALCIGSQPIYANPPNLDSPTDSTPVTDVKVIILGDSLSAAYNIEQQQGWVSLLQNLLTQKSVNAHLINASISGETSGGGLERLPRLLTQYKPDIVLIELGGNDGLRGFALNVTRSNLSRLIDLSTDAGAEVLLAGIQMPPNLGRTYTQRFSKIYTDLAEHPKVELIPFILEGVAANPEFMQLDRIHPNAKGQPIIMNTVLKYLEPMLNR